MMVFKIKLLFNVEHDSTNYIPT